MTGIAGQRTVTARWERGMRALVRAGAFDVLADEPHSAGGTDSGPQPTDLFLASIASCFALAIAWTADKKGVRLPPLRVRVTGTYDGPRFSAVDIEVHSSPPVPGLDELLREAERVCYVTNTLRSPPLLRVSRTTA
jgi:uncharacterized OsmC-like protein